LPPPPLLPDRSLMRASPTIKGNTITGNTSGFIGGGIAVDFNSSPTIKGNTIAGNTAEGGTIAGEAVEGLGSGIYIHGSSPTISSNTFENNRADKGGAIWVSDG